MSRLALPTGPVSAIKLPDRLEPLLGVQLVVSPAGLGVCSESIVIIIVILLILITEDIITITEGIHAVRRETKTHQSNFMNLSRLNPASELRDGAARQIGTGRRVAHLPGRSVGGSGRSFCGAMFGG